MERKNRLGVKFDAETQTEDRGAKSPTRRAKDAATQTDEISATYAHGQIVRGSTPTGEERNASTGLKGAIRRQLKELQRTWQTQKEKEEREREENRKKNEEREKEIKEHYERERKATTARRRNLWLLHKARETENRVHEKEEAKAKRLQQAAEEYKEQVREEIERMIARQEEEETKTDIERQLEEMKADMRKEVERQVLEKKERERHIREERELREEREREEIEKQRREARRQWEQKRKQISAAIRRIKEEEKESASTSDTATAAIPPEKHASEGSKATSATTDKSYKPMRVIKPQPRIAHADLHREKESTTTKRSNEDYKLLSGIWEPKSRKQFVRLTFLQTGEDLDETDEWTRQRRYIEWQNEKYRREAERRRNNK